MNNIRYELAGWSLFVVCSLLYLMSSIKTKDFYTFAGSVLFFIACILFIIPLIRVRTIGLKKERREDKNNG